MNNPERILYELDQRLKGTLELNLFGRAAIALGYIDHEQKHGSTHDVDAILAHADLETTETASNFWEIQEELNKALEPDGLYMTHIFMEDQIIIQPDWKDNRVEIRTEYKNIKLYRPSTVDLILTKMMRDDPQDMQDIAFLIKQDRITPTEIENAIQNARFPDIPEIIELFNKAKETVKKLAADSQNAGMIR